MISSIVNKPNRVVEMQKFVQNSHAPVYYRLPRSKLYVNSYYALFTVGMGLTTVGIYQLLRGKPASE